ncbi:response regulator [Rhodovarius crocodyli]|uniref:Response regulator n=1 Tax=Rhodovarius crocodyli TaxID=1979269 RepID=A0A437MDS8_9PROT|nr:response regulator [Rhodovarius crocodyli]RVT95795.1 response regulator [Rhodovarius crocodyli]
MTRPDDRLRARRVLIVEDEYYIAQDLRIALESEGAEILGPVASVDEALAFIEEGGLDAAVLDVNLESDGSAYPVAEALRARGIPFVFATGYDLKSIRADFDAVPHIAKPFEHARLIGTLSDQIGAR